MGFFNDLYDGEVKWAFHTTMTCDLRYSIELEYMLNKKDSQKDILIEKKEIGKNAIFYYSNPNNNNTLSCKMKGKKNAVYKYKDIVHPVESKETLHAKISLISYKKNNADAFRLAVYSKNQEFTDQCIDSALLFDIDVDTNNGNDTFTGNGLCSFIEFVYNNTDDNGKKWLNENITDDVKNKLRRANLKSRMAQDKNVEIFFGGINQSRIMSLGYYLNLEQAEEDSIVLTPPEFLRGTDMADFFDGKKILYDLKKKVPEEYKKYNSSHIKLYLLHKKDCKKKDYYELWLGSANASLHGMGWDSNKSVPSEKVSIECLVRFRLEKEEFDSLGDDIKLLYEPFSFSQSEGSLCKKENDDFGPWVCFNTKIDDIRYYKETGDLMNKGSIKANKEKVKKVEVAFKTTNEQIKTPDFKSWQCWRPLEYDKQMDCDKIKKGSTEFILTYDIETFREIQGAICLGISQSIMWIPEDKLASLPYTKDDINKDFKEDVRVSEALLNSSYDLEISEHEGNERINWYYQVLKSQDNQGEYCLPDLDDIKDCQKSKPMDFQKNAAKRLKEIFKTNSRAFLADEPGLGKTFSTAKLICDMAIDYFKSQGQRPFYAIYVAPNRALINQNMKELLSKSKEYLESVNEKIDLVDLNYFLEKSQVVAEAFIKTIDSERKYAIEKLGEDREKLKNKKTAFTEEQYKAAENRVNEIFNSIDVKKIINETTYFNERIIAQKIVAMYHQSLGLAGNPFEKDLQNDEYNFYRNYKDNRNQFIVNNELMICDRLAFADKVISNIKNGLNKKSIVIISVSQEVLLDPKTNSSDDSEIISKGEREYIESIRNEREYIESIGKKFMTDEMPEKNGLRMEFTKYFLKNYGVSIIIWDEFHRYATKLINKKTQNPFFEYEENGLKNLFVSATPYRTNISDRAENMKLFANAVKNYDDEDLLMTNLKGFEEDFVDLYCGGIGEKINKEELKEIYSSYISNPKLKNKEFESIMRKRMVRHERSRLQGVPEKHIRRFIAEDISNNRYRKVFCNTLVQSRLLEKAGYKEGARKMSLNLPWILDFPTDRGKITKGSDKASSFYDLLDPKRNSIDLASDEYRDLFVYESYDKQVKVKPAIATLPEQNIAFHQICESNVKGNMRQLLWVPATAPLYSAGRGSIFTEYSDYSKLLVFAEYRYLQRGGARLVSDYAKYENMYKKDIPDDFDTAFPPELNFSDKATLSKLSKIGLLENDFRDMDLDGVLEKFKGETEKWNMEDKQAELLLLAAIASPAVCIYRLLDIQDDVIRCSLASEIEESFNIYFRREGQKAALWSWIVDNGFSKKEDWTKGLLRYCAEGNLYSVLEEWLFILKKSSNAKDDDEVLVKKVEEICNKLTSYEGSTVHVQTYETIRDGNDGYEGKCSFAEQYVGDMSDNGGGNLNEDQLKISGVFSSPMWPMILFAGRGAQEGVDFHEYSSKIMHLTLPRGAVSYEQRNGRIDRYRSLLVRRRVAEYFENYAIKESDGKKDASQLLERMFAKASEMQKELGQERDKIYPNWHFNVLENSRWHFEEYIPMWDYTYEKADIMKYDEMYKSFRGSLGMSANMKGDEGIDLSAWNDEK